MLSAKLVIQTIQHFNPIRSDRPYSTPMHIQIRNPFLPKERAHRLLRLRRQIRQQLVGVQAGSCDQLFRSAYDTAGGLALQGLGLKGLRDEGEAFRGLGHDGWILPITSLVSRC